MTDEEKFYSIFSQFGDNGQKGKAFVFINDEKIRIKNFSSMILNYKDLVIEYKTKVAIPDKIFMKWIKEEYLVYKKYYDGYNLDSDILLSTSREKINCALKIRPSTSPMNQFFVSISIRTSAVRNVIDNYEPFSNIKTDKKKTISREELIDI